MSEPQRKPKPVTEEELEPFPQHDCWQNRIEIIDDQWNTQAGIQITKYHFVCRICGKEVDKPNA